MTAHRANEVKLIYPLVRQTTVVSLETSLDAFEYALQFYDEETIHHHITTKVILLNGYCQVLGVVTISESAHTYDVVETKFILQAAILSNAKAIIVVSNSPDGVVEPNEREQELYRQVKVAAALFAIQLTDYLLITSDNYYSYTNGQRS